MSSSTALPPHVRVADSLAKLDTLTASLVARQSRTNDGSMSVPDQVAAMTEWCAKQNPPIEIGNVYTEYDVSGRKPLAKRKGLLKAVEDVESGAAQIVLTAYFDRFVRSVQTRADVLVRVEDNCGGSVMTMDFGKTSNATPVSKFTGTVLAAAAELIAEQSAEKTAVTKQRNLDNGVPPFPRITLAYVRRTDGTLEQHPTYGPLFAEACERRARGVSYTQITRWLVAEGVVDAKGKPVTQNAVISTLSSRLLVGEMHFGKFTPNLKAIDNPVTDHATFRRMHSTRSTRGRYTKSERLLARLKVLRCATCDSCMSVQTTRGANGKPYAYYRCGNRLCEAGAVIACDAADDAVRDAAIEASAKFEGRAEAGHEVVKAEQLATKAKAKLAKTIRLVINLEDEDEAQAILDEVQAERDAAVAKHERLLRLVTPDMTVTTLAGWNDLTLDEQRSVVQSTIASAVVAPGRGDSRVVVVPHALVK